jgi:hypothetical protein
LYIFTGGTGEHEKVEVSAYAAATLEKIRASDEQLHGRILAALEYYFQAWIPGDAEPEGIDHFAKLSRAAGHDIYRIKDKQLLGNWRVLVLFVPRPPKNPMVAELMLYCDDASYNDLQAQHNKNVRRLVQDLILKGRMRRR